MLKVCDLADSFMREEPGLSGNDTALLPQAKGEEDSTASASHSQLQKEVSLIITIL